MTYSSQSSRCSSAPVYGIMLLILLSLPSAVAEEVAAHREATASGLDTWAARPCDCHATVRPQDQIWVVDVRDATAHWPCEGYRPPLQYFRYAGAHDWQSSDLDAFLAEDRKTSLTLFWVHGNRVDSAEAKDRGLAVYRALVAEANDDRPIRFVVLSWPSSKVRGPLIDIRLKAQRSGPAGCQLAWLVDHIDPKTSIGMIGYSFGARVITEALHVLGGGKVCNERLRERKHPARRPARTVLAAAAINDDWLLPDRPHGKAFSQIERLLLLNNHCDRVMRWYRLVERWRRPRALGRNGLALTELLTGDADKVEQFDVCQQVGRSHDFMLYLDCPPLMSAIWSTLTGRQDD